MVSEIEKALTRELGIRRVFIFFSAILAIAVPAIIVEEHDIFLDFDEYVIFAIAIIVLVLIFISRKKLSLPELRKQHNIILALFIIALIARLYVISTEIQNLSDFAYEILVPEVILLILAVVNRFL